MADPNPVGLFCRTPHHLPRVSRRKEFDWRTLIVLSVLFLSTGIGCGGSGGPVRVSAKGSVDLNGVPMANGSITFVPTGGEKGVSANGPIKGGQFSIPASEGPTAGKYVAMISMVVGTKDAGVSNPAAPSQKSKWEVSVEIPDTGLEKDFFLDNK